MVSWWWVCFFLVKNGGGVFFVKQMLSAIITIRELAVMSLLSPRTDWLRLLEVLVKKEVCWCGISGAKWIRIARFRWIFGLSLLYINVLRL